MPENSSQTALDRLLIEEVIGLSAGFLYDDGDFALNFPSDLQARAASDDAVARLIDSETRLFLARSKARQGRKAQLRERIAQLSQEIAGINDQIAAKTQRS